MDVDRAFVPAFNWRKRFGDCRMEYLFSPPDTVCSSVTLSLPPCLPPCLRSHCLVLQKEGNSSLVASPFGAPLAGSHSYCASFGCQQGLAEQEMLPEGALCITNIAFSTWAVPKPSADKGTGRGWSVPACHKQERPG